MEAMGERTCPCANALAGAIITDPVKIPADKKAQLRLLVEKYVEI
jgi:hypothetical protein